MPDGLNDEERVYAWLASWNPSFAGKAIVNPDFTFRAVNQQFCKIMGVTPGELVGSKFTDLTPEPLKSLDAKNAELVKNGVVQSYLLPKTYEFLNGQRVDVTLLVNGVYHPDTKKFMFFVSTIMERKEMKSLVAPSQMPTGLLELVGKSNFWFAILTAIGLVLAVIIEKVLK